MDVIRQIADEIRSVEGVRLLNIDPGAAANRTVFTFVGSPADVVEAAFRGARAAARLIDMRQHQGTHPRIGATDVLPLIPVAGITLEECANLARQLAERMVRELDIPCYAYEASAFIPEHRNLAVCRAGEYEALERKLFTPGLQPDFIPASVGSTPEDIPEAVRRAGCSVVGARDFLIAVNFNLNTTSTQIASAIACDVREKGRPKRDEAGNPVLDTDGNRVMIPGTLKCTKAIGWYIDEYGIAQVSMNMTNIHVTPLHAAYEEVCRCAQNRGVRVTGTEIIGLVPKKSLVDAGLYFLRKQNRPVDISEAEVIDTAIRSMSLDDLRPFNPRQKVIEYLMEDAAGNPVNPVSLENPDKPDEHNEG